MEDNITIDTDALQKEIMNSAEKDGFTIKAYCPFVDLDKLAETSHVMPLVNVEGYTNPITIAFMVKALDGTIAKLKSRDGVKEALAFVDLVSSQRDVEVENTERSANND